VTWGANGDSGVVVGRWAVCLLKVSGGQLPGYLYREIEGNGCGGERKPRISLKKEGRF